MNNRSHILKKDVSAPRQAFSRTQSEVARILRGIKSSGMLEDDKKTLQLFKEYKQYLEGLFKSQEEAQNTRQIIDNQARADSDEKKSKSMMIEQMQRKKERAKKFCMSEEHHALTRRPDVKRWLDLVAQNKCEPNATFRMRPVLCRVVVKRLPPVSCLRSLQLSSNQLTDRVGSHIGKMVRINKSLTKLDLSGNLLGPSSIAQLGDALRENRTLRTLDLSSNPITVGNNGRELVGVKAMSDMLAVTESLLCLNISSTGLGSEGGALMAAGLGNNSSVIILENTNNGIDLEDQTAIMTKLVANRQLRESNKRLERAMRVQKRRKELLEEQKRIQVEKEAEEKTWMAQRRQVRVEARREVAEQERERRLEARAQLLAMLKAKAEEAELLKMKKKKKRKGRRRKKKKKKK